MVDIRSATAEETKKKKEEKKEKTTGRKYNNLPYSIGHIIRRIHAYVSHCRQDRATATVTCTESFVKFRLWSLRYASGQTYKQTDIDI